MVLPRSAPNAGAVRAREHVSPVAQALGAERLRTQVLVLRLASLDEPLPDIAGRGVKEGGVAALGNLERLGEAARVE